MSCDYRIMVDSDRAKIGLNAALLGIKAPFWFRDTMINTIGYRETERALQTARIFTPKQALELGLVDELVATPDELLARAKERMKEWTRIPGRIPAIRSPSRSSRSLIYLSKSTQNRRGSLHDQTNDAPGHDQSTALAKRRRHRELHRVHSRSAPSDHARELSQQFKE